MKLEQEKKKRPYFKVIIFSAIISFVVFMVILFIIPYTVNNWVISSVGNNESSLAGSWISFWGSFLGGIVGMFAVLLTTYLLIKSQNKHHKEQLEQQRDDVVNSINSSVRLEREKFMVQFNIEKYEKVLLLIIKLENKVNIHIQKYNDARSFILNYFKFQLSPGKVVPDQEYQIYLKSIDDVANEIRGMMQELTTLEKILKSFNLEKLDNVIYQYLTKVSINSIQLNSASREKILQEKNITNLLNETIFAISNCEEQLHLCIKKELEKYRHEPEGQMKIE